MLCTSAEQTELEPAVASPLLALAKWAVAHLLVDGARLQGLPVFAANTALSHLTLLRLCECVCLRLYCLKLTGAIPENNAFEDYMYGLVELEDAYSLVPCARLSVNIIVAASVAESNFLPESASGQFLRRSLMLWLCVRDRNRHSDHHHQQQHQQQQQLLLGDALNSARFIREDEWPQGAVGLLVLGDAAANGETFILRELQRSFAGVPPYPEGLGEIGAAATVTAAFLWQWPWQMSCIFPSVLSDVALHGRTAELRKMALVGEAGSADEALAPCGPGSGPKGGGLLQLTQLNSGNDQDDDADGAGPPVSLSAAVRCSSARALRRLCRGLQQAGGEDGASPRGLPSLRPGDPFLGSALGGASVAEERERDAAVQAAWRRSSVTQRDHWPALRGPRWPICCAEHKVTTTHLHHHHHLSTTTKPRQRRRPGPLEEICGSHLNPPRESFFGFLSLQVDNPAPLSSRGPTLTCDRSWTANSPAASERLAGGNTKVCNEKKS
ncbi:transmembrane protein 232 isoform X2 [Lethenteron reissneri]|uniref:transmembrane protein 232 isoform X2 n=1 Tax=Lethenteron reissneri TaxID=7753 RepID=UPI002AB6A3BD|nr:transmembrane protein 232 isoform X2 [Lethenteron reissneri]